MSHKYESPSRTKWLAYGLIIGFLAGLVIGAAGLDAVLGLKLNVIMKQVPAAFGL